MLFAIYLDGTVSISELFWNFLHFIHKNRIIMGGGGTFFCPPIVNISKLGIFFNHIDESEQKPFKERREHKAFKEQV